MLGVSLGSTSITIDSTGAKISELRYKSWGEVRCAWTAGVSTTPAYTLSQYTFTGQYSYTDDLTTTEVTEGFGLMFYNARWYDPALGRFAQADTIIPQSQGVQAWDRFAYTNNNPVRYTDPSGHQFCDEDGNCLDSQTKKWKSSKYRRDYWDAPEDEESKDDLGAESGTADLFKLMRATKTYHVLSRQI
ncbi:MAG: hypothetical protein DPW18_13775 [Chloroflexi bacterium]|nr:hypothetical protein [Chloroflexota bacterium]